MTQKGFAINIWDILKTFGHRSRSQWRRVQIHYWKLVFELKTCEINDYLRKGKENIERLIAARGDLWNLKVKMFPACKKGLWTSVLDVKSDY